TSQRGRVAAVDTEAGTLTVAMDDGKTHVLGPDETSSDRLAHGYATTIHRSQGATFGTTHLFADGGGRELGYVAMSRARNSATVHVIADNIGQAVEDLSWDWGRERRQFWAIDTGTPDTPVGRHPLETELDKQVPADLRAVLWRARLKAERSAVVSLAPAGSGPNSAGRVAYLDRNIEVLDRHLEPRRRQPPAPQRPASTGMAGAERSSGPEV
ncbi:MAG TPA: hypothetical protein VMF65_15115, partial [Acidimicrobiales bacterium]|nr:hypothetical protein [Acidimicrobiales bacterium]